MVKNIILVSNGRTHYGESCRWFFGISFTLERDIYELNVGEAGCATLYIYFNAAIIEEVEGENGEVKTIYDLTGRKIENPARGIYIVNGNKVVIK